MIRRALELIFKQPLSLAASESVCIQYSSSGTMLQSSLAFGPVTMYVCGWCTAAGRDRITTTFSRAMQQPNLHRRTTYDTRYRKVHVISNVFPGECPRRFFDSDREIWTRFLCVIVKTPPVSFFFSCLSFRQLSLFGKCGPP